MGRASFVTPVYFFSSIKAGSGKASLIANYAVFLNNLGNKVAVIDLDATAPLKLKNSFPQSVNFQEYNDLGQILNAGDSRYQRTFYFTDTEKISYFPATGLQAPDQLFHDAALRDFFLQTRATFDVLIINFPPGDKVCLEISELLSQNQLWHGSRPVSVIVSQADCQSLLKLDGITRKASALLFQLRENTAIVFNKVPASPEEQKLSDTALTNSELKKLFTFPNVLFIGNDEEFPHQRNISAPIVLKPDSSIGQSISKLHRLLNQSMLDSGTGPDLEASEFMPCLDGSLLEKLSPYLEKIQAAAAARLLTNPANIQVFLEESHGLYRIRIRVTGQRQRILGVPEKIQTADCKNYIVRPSPEAFHNIKGFSRQNKIEPLSRGSVSGLEVKPIYSFDDRFSRLTNFEIEKRIDFSIFRNAYPSPIIFKHDHQIPEIPSLSHILGFIKKTFVKFPFVYDQSIFAIPGVTHFFIPPEFKLVCQNECAFTEEIFADFSTISSECIFHNFELPDRYQLSDRPISSNFNVEDLFARCKSLCVSDKYACVYTPEYSLTLSGLPYSASLFVSGNPSDIPLEFYQTEIATPGLERQSLPEILRLYEPEEAPDSELFKKEKGAELFAKASIQLDCSIDFEPFANPVPAYREDASLMQRLKRPGLDFSYLEVSQHIQVNYLKNFQKKDSPVIDEFDHGIPDGHVSIIEPSVKPAPKNFKQEICLLEYNLETEKIVDQAGTFTSMDTSRYDCRNLIDYAINFPAEFWVQAANEDEIKPCGNKELKFKHSFKSFVHDFKKVEFYVPEGPERHFWDIMPTSLFAKKESDYAQLSGDDSYKSDQMLDSLHTGRSLSCNKSRMLELKNDKLEKLDRGIALPAVEELKPAYKDSPVAKGHKADLFEKASPPPLSGLVFPETDFVQSEMPQTPTVFVESSFVEIERTRIPALRTKVSGNLGKTPANMPAVSEKAPEKMPPRLDASAEKEHPNFSETTEVFAETSYFIPEFDKGESKKLSCRSDLPVIYTIPFHSYSSTVSSISFCEKPGDFIMPTMLPYDQKSEHSISTADYEYYLEIYDLEIPDKIPHRYKKMKDPELEAFSSRPAVTNIVSPGAEIVQPAISSNKGNFYSAVAGNLIVCQNPVIAKSYPMFKPLIDVEDQVGFSDTDFRISPPELLEELYQHVIHQFRFLCRREQEMFFKTFSIRPANFEISHVGRKLHFKEGIFFVRRILHSPEKLVFSGKRQKFEIANIKLKELLNFARQTSRKFTEFSSKNSS